MSATGASADHPPPAPRYYSRDEIAVVVGWMWEGLDLVWSGRLVFPAGQDRDAVLHWIDQAPGPLPPDLGRHARLQFRLAGLVTGCMAGEER